MRLGIPITLLASPEKGQEIIDAAVPALLKVVAVFTAEVLP